MNRLKQITAKAKTLYKTGKYKKWTDAIKQASKSLGATKSGTHKDTKSHNVNIRVVSGTITSNDFMRIDNDTNGNPRYVIHWLAVADTYDKALKIAKRIGGKKYHNKKYGGGIVFQSYNISETAKRLSQESSIGAVKIIQKGETPKSKVTKVLQQVRTKKGQFKGYRKIGSVTSANAKQLVIDSIDASGYGENPKTPDEKIRFLEKTFLSEYGWAVARYGKQRAIQEWLMGLPSSIHLPFANYDILQLAKSWGTLPYNATERQEDKILSNYWKLMASTILKLFNQRKKK